MSEYKLTITGPGLDYSCAIDRKEASALVFSNMSRDDLPVSLAPPSLELFKEVPHGAYSGDVESGSERRSSDDYLLKKYATPNPRRVEAGARLSQFRKTCELCEFPKHPAAYRAGEAICRACEKKTAPVPFDHKTGYEIKTLSPGKAQGTDPLFTKLQVKKGGL